MNWKKRNFFCWVTPIVNTFLLLLTTQRTYGKWWDLAPSRAIDIMPQTLNEHVSQDFIVMQFEDFVYPSQIYIFETYNPGAIVKLWAFTIAEKWMCLWENDCLDAEIASDSRVFAPPLKDIKTPTRIIRIEFSHRHLDYFTEIDAVVLQGMCLVTNRRFFWILFCSVWPFIRKLQPVLRWLFNSGLFFYWQEINTRGI